MIDSTIECIDLSSQGKHHELAKYWFHPQLWGCLDPNKQYNIYYI